MAAHRLTDDTLGRRNLLALSKIDPALAQRIANVASSPLVNPGASYPVTAPPGRRILCHGLTQAARDACASGAKVAVVEPAIERVAASLAVMDVSSWLLDGSLRLFCPPLQTGVLRQVSLQEISARCLSDLGAGEWSVHVDDADPVAPFLAQLSRALNLPQQIERRIESTVTPQQPHSAVTVVSPKCAIFDDLAHCLERLGVTTRLVRVPDRANTWPRDRWLHVLQALREAPSEVTVTRNRTMFESFAPGERYGLERHVPGRLVHWWWDIPNVASWLELRSPLAPADNIAFAREMLAVLPAGSLWLAPGARSDFAATANDPPVKIRHQLSFVGQSRYKAMLQNLQMLADGLAVLGGSPGRSIANDLARISTMADLHQYFDSRHADVNAVLEAIQAEFPAAGYFLSYLHRMCKTAVLRLQAVALLSSFSISVYGDQDWLEAGVVAPQSYMGLLAPSQLPNLYRSSLLNLNLNFMQVSSTVNPKVLDVCACGAAVLTDHRPELDELFLDPATRPPSFSSLDELPDRVADLLKHPATEATKRICQHVHQSHTMLQRARQLCDMLGVECLS